MKCIFRTTKIIKIVFAVYNIIKEKFSSKDLYNYRDRNDWITKKNSNIPEIFSYMQSSKFRRAFIEKKERSFNLNKREFDELKSYILSDVCVHDLERLKTGDYFIEAPDMRKVKKMNSTRRRTIYLFHGHSKMILQYLTFAIMHKYDYLYTSSLYSFRLNHTINDCFEMIKECDIKRKHYVLKLDIHQYANSIDQDIATKLIYKYMNDDMELCRFMDWLLHLNKFYVQEKQYLIRRWRRQSRYQTDREIAEEQNKEFHAPQLREERVSMASGMPLGNMLYNLYLIDVDNIMRDISYRYIRYSDDVCAFFDTRKQAENAMIQFKKMLADLKIKLNVEKSEIINSGQTFDLLGFKISKQGIDISDNAVAKIKFRFKRRRDKLLKQVRYRWISKQEGMQMLIRQINLYFFGAQNEDHELNWVRWCFGNLTTPDGLREIDNYLQDCIRVVGSAKHTNAKYRITYEKMCKMGYISLVHAYYHGYNLIERETYLREFCESYYNKVNDKRTQRFNKIQKCD